MVLLSGLLSAQQIEMRINTRISSESAKPGMPFGGSLMNPVQIAGRSCAKGSPGGGIVTEAKSSGRLSSPGVLALQPTWISCSGRRLNVSAEPVQLEGRSHTKNNAVLIGGGAAAGGILGAILGGGKGAAIGAGVGAGTGTVAAAATGKHEAVIEPEAVVGWNLNRDSRVADDPRHTQDHQYHASNDDRHRHHNRDQEEYDDHDRHGDNHPVAYRITQHDRTYLQRCLVSNYRLPPGLAKQGKIPPGHARKMQQAGYGEPIPGACTAELSPIPHGWERVIIESRVVLFDPSRREIDYFVWRN
jgi:hypothetical protein